MARKVAVKLISPELTADERFRDRFLRESRLAASLDHPHIVPIHGAGELDGVLFLAMRYVEGTDLAKLLAEEGAVDPARAISLLEQVAEALDAAHERGLVHRDVKPSNVLIAVAAGKEHCYLADFGLTKRTASLSGVTAPGDVVGTLEYVAPEQITGGEVTSRADLYSLACVLYESLTGTTPFPRATDVALLWAHVHEEPKRASELRPELPKTVAPVLARGLAKDPARRYRTCGELVSAVRSSLGLIETAPAPTKQLRWAIAAVVLVLVTAVALGFLLSRDAGDLSSASPNSVGVIDPDSNELVTEVAVGPQPEGVAVGEGAVWVATFEDGTVWQIDPKSRRPVRTISVEGNPGDVVVGHGRIWVGLSELTLDLRGAFPRYVQPAETFFPKLSWFNPAAATVETATLEGLVCGGPVVRVAVGRKAAWFACSTYLARVDLRTGKLVRAGQEALVLGDPRALATWRGFSDVAFGLGSLRLANRSASTITEIDPATSRIRREITVGRPPSAIAVGPSTVWAASYEDDTVTRIGIPGRGQPVSLTTIPVGDGPADIAVGKDGVWVTNSLDGTVSRIDPTTNEVVATIEVGNQPQRVAVGERAVWVTVQASAFDPSP